MSRESFYRPPLPDRRESRWILSPAGNYPYRVELLAVRELPRFERIAALVELQARHDPDLIVHAFEVTNLATGLAEHQFAGKSMEKIREVFEDALLHDVGKTGVPVELLHRNSPDITPEEKHAVLMHGPLGGEILKNVGLRWRAYAALEHHIASGLKGVQWKEEDLTLRHPLTPTLSLADLVTGMMDPRRPYIKPKTQWEVEEIVRKKQEYGVYSQDLAKAFEDVVLAKGRFPPYRLEDYERSMLFMHLVREYGLMEIFGNSIRADQEKRKPQGRFAILQE